MQSESLRTGRVVVVAVIARDLAGNETAQPRKITRKRYENDSPRSKLISAGRARTALIPLLLSLPALPVIAPTVC
jgi:hypothetical protein